ncbi:peptidase S41-like protein [Mucilaginibacter gracilis]|uniref:Peptidase S41-like protein n=1 Tax=Mucilaginibacter gracilis TaxID=423350 RepID=A0A495JAQ9_9SPHI|nr:S41 family peptidase [Mucilaginibacter gracilis]RKR85442.1 peptidase S41-like protein [Mucilaginibacter gracilis]
MKKNFYLLFVALTALATTSCKHHTETPSIDLVKDSVYMYAREDYLWYDALPTTDAFNPRGFTASSDLAALQKEVDALSQYKINPVTGKPYEYNRSYPGESKYSFIDQGQTSTILGGNNADFGFFPVFGPLSNTDLRVRYVNPGSPAANAGLHRGELITNIVGVPKLDTNSTNINYINRALSANSITMTLQRSNGTTYTATVTAASYTANPVMKDSVYTTSNGKKVGYLVLSTFTDLKTNAKAPLDAAFNYFIAQNITDLVVDLRYNGGGFVETAEYLDNLIAPASLSGSPMYTAYYNNKLQANNYPLLTNLGFAKDDFTIANNTSYFSKQKTLNITGNVIFIITGRTASASELTINNLRPHMNVKLVGTTSYGKPVGFFYIPIDTYELYLSEFETKNSAGQGGYYSGMTAGSTDYPGYYSADDVAHDFGDPTENLLARSLSYINVGTFSIPDKQIESTNGVPTLSVAQQAELNSKIKDHNAFTGMLFKDRFKARRRH